MPKAKAKTLKQVEALKHEEASRKNIPTAEYQSLIEKEDLSPVQIAYQRRNRDLDPQLVWRGKDEQDWSELVVPAPPLYIQEKVHPKVLIDDLLRRSQEGDSQQAGANLDLFADFNGLPSPEARTEFYRHDQNWSNRMILGDSLQVMASLAEREGLRGSVQCVYVDPPYGITFNSNFQWSTTSHDVKDGRVEHITREPEQVKAFRDTWRDGLHSYLTYLRDRLDIARELLNESGSIFVQIGIENVHRIRALLDEIFGEQNYCGQIVFRKTARTATSLIPQEHDFLLWYCRNRAQVKYRELYQPKDISELRSYKYIVSSAARDARLATPQERNNISARDGRLAQLSFAVSGDPGRPDDRIYRFRGRDYDCGAHRHWKTTNPGGLNRLAASDRLIGLATQLNYIRYFEDFSLEELTTQWLDTGSAGFSNADPKVYVVQTDVQITDRCVLMTTDPGDLVLDPTCGAGTAAMSAERWGRRWIAIDTSRVALALARARIMGARYPYYLLADSREGQVKEAEVAGTAPSSHPTRGNIRHGFVYERLPHITLKSIANNAEIDVISEQRQKTLEPLRRQLNSELKKQWQEWEIPRGADPNWPDSVKTLHAEWWQQRTARQRDIDASIAAKAEFEYLYDKPYPDNKKVRVAGPFTVESLMPHRVLSVDENDHLIDSIADKRMGYEAKQDFPSIIIENLRIAGVQQAHKEDKIVFTSLMPWPGRNICAEGRYVEGTGKAGKRAAIFIGPEFGTVSRPDLVEAAREAADGGFDVLIACAFNYEAHASEFSKLGKIPVLKARMNADLHMADDLKNTGKGNLFVIFGEPDIEIIAAADNQIQVKVKGVDVFDPTTGEVRSDSADGIACWFIDTDYNEESFFVRHAYFLGQNDPYSALKTTLRAEINEEAWATLHSDTSRPFLKPEKGRIAVKVINHLGDEVMKVFKVS